MTSAIEVTDLTTHFRSERGLVRAVDGLLSANA